MLVRAPLAKQKQHRCQKAQTQKKKRNKRRATWRVIFRCRSRHSSRTPADSSTNTKIKNIDRLDNKNVEVKSLESPSINPKRASSAFRPSMAHTSLVSLPSLSLLFFFCFQTFPSSLRPPLCIYLWTDAYNAVCETGAEMCAPTCFSCPIKANRSSKRMTNAKRA